MTGYVLRRLLQLAPVLLLFPHYTKEDGPKVVSKGNGVWIVTVRRPVATEDQKATLGFGITVAGTTKQ